MQLCDTGHQEICYDGRSCPLCDTISEKDSEISELKDKIAELEKEIEAAS